MVWVALTLPQPRPNVNWRGSPEYMSLFTPDAPWPKAAAHVNVFKIGGYQAKIAPESELRQMFTELDRRHIALGLEIGILPRLGCGVGVEGFDGAGLLVAARRIRSFGGKIRYLSMDEPYFFGSMYTGHDACRWSTEEVAKHAAETLKAFKAEFPEVVIGDEEPMPVYIQGWLDRYRDWIGAFRAATGADMAYFHADVQWQNGTWPRDLDTLRKMVEQQGITVGVFYKGQSLDQTDAEWVEQAQKHFEEYELRRRPPVHVLFQSWEPCPQHLLPETDAVSFTNLINRYFRPRTQLTVRAKGRRLEGRLTIAGGKLIGGVPVKLMAAPQGEELQPVRYTIIGTVPSAAREAFVGFRVNVACACSGTADFTLESFDYQESGPGGVRGHWDFSKGLEGWALSNHDLAKVDSGSLHVTTAAGQGVTLHSTSFHVTPGAAYSLRISARVAPRSTGSGFFAITYPVEKSVKLTPIDVPANELATTTTAADGSYRFNLPQALPHENEIHVRFPGNESFWPAEATIGTRERIMAADEHR